MKLIVNWIIPMLCAIYVSLVIGQHFTPTAFRYLFLAFLFFFIARLYLKTFTEKHKGEPLNKKILITAFILSIVITWLGRNYVVPEVVRSRRVAEITLTALGKKNEKSSAYEVWLKEINNNGPVDLHALPLNGGWKLKDNSAYAADQFPATLHVKLDYVSKNASLVFLKHGWSGMVQITNGKEQEIIDLYADESKEYKYPVDVKQATVLNDSAASHVTGYVLSALFYAIFFYFLFYAFLGRRLSKR
ncbi:hypothetical protein [Longitalea arenae]|uniref:hypothetical protein n=1 Tax=Longitalea arenae TaxID=2812558 RepID=UPI0019678493|nr:hypothetical protein [Longitalea arenae]